MAAIMIERLALYWASCGGAAVSVVWFAADDMMVFVMDTAIVMMDIPRSAARPTLRRSSMLRFQRIITGNRTYERSENEKRATLN